MSISVLLVAEKGIHKTIESYMSIKLYSKTVNNVVDEGITCMKRTRLHK